MEAHQAEDISTREIFLEAVRAGEDQLVSDLLNNGAQIDARDNDGNTALALAVEADSIETCKVLLQHGVTRTVRMESTLLALSKSRNFDLVSLLIKLPEDFKFENTESGIDLLGYAADAGHLQAVKYLLQHRYRHIRPMEKWTSALHLAAAKGYLSIVKALCEEAKPESAISPRLRNGGGFTPLMVACYNDRAGVASYLLSKHTATYELDDRADNTLTVLLLAILKTKNVKLVREVLQAGADPNAAYGREEKVPPLIIAIREGSLDIAECLVEEGANVNATDDEGHTAYYYAHECGYDHLLDMLEPEDLLESHDETVSCQPSSVFYSAVGRLQPASGWKEVDSSDPQAPVSDSTNATIPIRDSTGPAQILSDGSVRISKTIPEFDGKGIIQATINLCQSTETWNTIEHLEFAIVLDESSLDPGGSPTNPTETYIRLIQRSIQLEQVRVLWSGQLPGFTKVLQLIDRKDAYVPRNKIAQRRELFYAEVVFTYFKRKAGNVSFTDEEEDALFRAFIILVETYRVGANQRRVLLQFFTDLCRFSLDSKVLFPNLEQTIRFVEEALKDYDQLAGTKEAKEAREFPLFVLKDLYQALYNRTDLVEHLETAISYESLAVRQRPELWNTYPARLLSLANRLKLLYKRTNDLDMLGKSINFYRENLKWEQHAVAQIFGNNNLAHALWLLYERTSDPEVLDEAARLAQKAYELMKQHPRLLQSLVHAEILETIGNILSEDPNNLERCIEVQAEALLISSRRDSCRAIKLINLANSYCDRYDRYNQSNDLETASSYMNEAYEIEGMDKSTTELIFNGLGNILAKRLLRIRGIEEDYNRLVMYRERVLDIGVSRFSRDTYLNNLAASLTTRYQKFGRSDDLQRAITIGSECIECIDSVPINHMNRRMYLNNQAHRYRLLAQLSDPETNLDESIGLSRKAGTRQCRSFKQTWSCSRAMSTISNNQRTKYSNNQRIEYS